MFHCLPVVTLSYAKVLLERTSCLFRDCVMRNKKDYNSAELFQINIFHNCYNVFICNSLKNKVDQRTAVYSMTRGWCVCGGGGGRGCFLLP